MLAEHAHQHAERVVARLGGPLSTSNLAVFLEDPAGLRWPTTIAFDAAPLEAHQFAQPVIDGTDNARKCTLYVHPRFQGNPIALPYFLAYFVAVINYGITAGPELCERIGALLMGGTPDEFYRAIVELVDNEESSPAQVI